MAIVEIYSFFELSTTSSLTSFCRNTSIRIIRIFECKNQ